MVIDVEAQKWDSSYVKGKERFGKSLELIELRV